MVIAAEPDKPQPAHHKKRHGRHHKSTTQHYVKTYWPYLPIALLIAGGVYVNSILSQGTGSVLGQASHISRTALLEETNTQRLSVEEPALAQNEALNKAAQAKADDMARRNYWSHNTPDGHQPWYFISETQYRYATAGENLAYGFATEANTVAGWMNSTAHRDNLLNPNFRDVGFGVAQAPDFLGKGPETIVVALYALPQSDSAVLGMQTNNPNSLPTPALRPQSLARIDLLTRDNWLWITALVVIAVASAAVYVLHHHRKAWHRSVVTGEQFILHHPVADIFVVAVVIIAALLLRPSGTIF